LALAGRNLGQGIRANSNRRGAYRGSRRDKPGGSPVVLLAAGIITALTSTAVACGDCSWVGNGFSIPHPRAIEIAVATRDALDAGLIEDSPRTAQADALIARRVAMLVPGDWAAGDSVIEILWVDDNITFHFAARDKRIVASAGPKPATRKLTVVTTGPTAAALAMRRLSLDDAVTRGLVIVERSPIGVAAPGLARVAGDIPRTIP
jgi:hypothetical protein